MFDFRIVLRLVITLSLFVIGTSGKGGSTIFYKRNGRECWSHDDMAKLRVRRIFEKLMPSPITPNKVDQKYTRNVLRYFRDSLRAVSENPDQNAAAVMKEALLDTIGSHLRSELLPTVRFSYYAGYIPLRSARMVHDYFDQLKVTMNTQGLGWIEPDKVPHWANLSVNKVLIGPTFFDSCSHLVAKRDSNSCIHLPLPKLDDPKQPSAIALPFKTGGFVSLTSPKSENMLLKYYTTTSRCILSSSPGNCRHSDFVNFNNELWHWMKRDVAPYLIDEKLYSAYGGVLRIAAAVQSYGKGLSRRNLFDSQDAGITKWRPWQLLTQSYLCVNADWTPKVYIALVLLAALAIYLLQTCFHYIFGNSYCDCERRKKLIKDVSYANVDSNFPAMLPSHQSAVFFAEQKKTRMSSSSKPKTSSVGSIKTQKVYDLNENTEKLMAVIMSDKEESEIDSVVSKNDSETDIDKTIRLKSPPELKTSISQLRVKSSPRERTQTTMYSTSTLTHSDLTQLSGHERQGSESGSWSGSTSSTSGQMVSSGSSKSRKSRSTRDLAWARRVISKSKLYTQSQTKSNSGTELLDVISFTTPPSQL